MTILLGILTFFVVLATLILVHELGHFSAAKLAGVRVEEFGFGFPPRIRGWRLGSTLYSINALPLGGFVRMMGENGDDAEPDSFGAQPAWQRFLILVAGPAMNLALAVIIFFFVFLAGSPRGITVVTAVAKGSPAAAAHLRVGDRIVAVDGQHVQYLEDLKSATDNHLGHRVTLVLKRGNDTVQTSLVPRLHPPQGQGAMGIELTKSTVVSYGPLTSLRLAFDQIGAMVTSLPLIVQSVSQHGGSGVAGPVGIAHITTRVVQDEPTNGLGSIFLFVALLSANLGVLNLLPVPALDGGRILFVLVSWVRRRNLDPEVEGLIHMVGMATLLLLILLISYNDVSRWISGGS